MATVTRVNGSSTTVGTLYNQNVNLYIIQVKNTNNANIDLQAEDSNGANAVINGVVESIVRELNPLAWFTPSDVYGFIYVVMDKAINSASELQIRIRRLGLQTNGTTAEIGRAHV